MTVQLSPLARQRFTDSSGVPLAGGYLYTYQAGTSTPAATYTDSTGATPNTNPVLLDSRGECDLWLTNQQAYKIVLTDANNNQIWSRDQITAPITAFNAANGLTSAAVAGVLNSLVRTAAEIAAGVLPTDYSYPPGNVRRYGVTGDGTIDDRAALNTANSVGITLDFPAGTYRVASNLTLSTPCIFEKGAILKPDAAVTVTVSGSVSAGAYRIFNVTNASSAISYTAPDREIKGEWFGAVGDASTLNGAALKGAIAALPTGGSAYGGTVTLGYGIFLCDQQLALPNGVNLRGAGVPHTILRASAAFSATSLIKNAAQDGTQEWASLEGLQIDGNKAGGAVCSTAVVDFVSLFVNSYIRDCVIQNGSADNLHIGAAAAGGPFLVENSWMLSAAGNNVLIDESNTNVGAVAGICLRNCTVEHQGIGKAGVKIKGYGHIFGVNITDLHVEQANTGAGTYALQLDGAADVKVDGIQVQSASASSGGIRIENNGINVRYGFRNVTNINVVSPIIDDQKAGLQMGAGHIPWYGSPEIGIHQDRIQTLTYGATVSTDLLSGNYCLLSVTNGTGFTISNPVNAQVGERLTYEITNASGGAMGTITWGANFAYRDTWTNPANGKRRTISFRYRGSNVWAQEGAATGDM